MNPARVLCISGSGRSGSTLLSLLLSQNEDVLNLGQFRDLWKAYQENRGCSCDHPLQQCPQWSTAIEAALPDGLTALDVHRQMQSLYREIRKTRASELAQSTERIRSSHAQCLHILSGVLQSCRERSGASIFIDSSKSPEMAFAFGLLDDTEVYVVNLVRDPRALVCSWANKDGNSKRAAKAARDWVERQGRLRDWGRKGVIARLAHLRYEDLTARPQYYIETLLRWVGASPASEFFTAANQVEISWHRQHLFPPANESMLQRRPTAMEIREARSWRRLGNWKLHLAALRHSFPQGLQYALGQDRGSYLG